MRMLVREIVKVALVLAISVLTPGCALTTPVYRRVDGYTKTVPDSSPHGSHQQTYKPQPLYIPLLFITVPIDVVTYPLQLPFLPCIANYYDYAFCDAGKHDAYEAFAAHSQPSPSGDVR